MFTCMPEPHSLHWGAKVNIAQVDTYANTQGVSQLRLTCASGSHSCELPPQLELVNTSLSAQPSGACKTVVQNTPNQTN
jgi:hypothetical protein